MDVGDIATEALHVHVRFATSIKLTRAVNNCNVRTHWEPFNFKNTLSHLERQRTGKTYPAPLELHDISWQIINWKK